MQIRPVDEKDYAKVHAFQCEYLNREPFHDFVHRVEANPDLYLGAFDGDELIGICYGHPSHKMESAINLQGIAVSLDESKGYARKGNGSKLIAAFEEAVKSRGCSLVDLGAADDLKVEHFYLKNGYQPYELAAKIPGRVEIERVSVDDYQQGQVIREQLRRQYQPKEVIFIFQKRLG